VPTPWWCLQRDLARIGLDLARIRLVRGRTMTENLAAVADGTLDVAQVFEPFASRLVAGGGAVWHAQADRGPTAYTAFYAARTALTARRPALAAMLRGLASVQAWLHAATPAEIAATVAGYFAGHDPSLLEASIARYLALGLWSRTPRFPQDAFEELEAAMLGAGAIARRPGFAACVDNALVEEALA
jgi:NitT/TauT family transport system substrate-binding protein